MTRLVLFTPPATCPSLMTSLSGTVNLTTNGTISSATVSCAIGYTVIGEQQLNCLTNGSWDVVEPQCGVKFYRFIYMSYRKGYIRKDQTKYRHSDGTIWNLTAVKGTRFYISIWQSCHLFRLLSKIQTGMDATCSIFVHGAVTPVVSDHPFT